MNSSVVHYILVYLYDQFIYLNYILLKQSSITIVQSITIDYISLF